jgi:cellulose synthase (UDP-forming)
LLVQALLWSGLALRVHEFGWDRYWATTVLGAVQLYIIAPVLTPSKGIRGRARQQEVAT